MWKQLNRQNINTDDKNELWVSEDIIPDLVQVATFFTSSVKDLAMSFLMI